MRINEIEMAYHVTPTDNVRSILRDGLIPTVGERSSVLSEKPCVFLFPSRDHAEDAVANWLGDLFEDGELSLLQVDISGLPFENTVDYELQVFATITPDRIKILDSDF